MLPISVAADKVRSYLDDDWHYWVDTVRSRGQEIRSARERLQARLYERLRRQQQEMQPIPLEDIDDTCVIFWSKAIGTRRDAATIAKLLTSRAVSLTETRPDRVDLVHT